MRYILFITLCFFQNFFEQKEIKICDNKFKKNVKTFYNKDLDINIKMVVINNYKTNKFVFGLFEKTYKNDTLFIFSDFKFTSSGFQIKDYYNFNIQNHLDSTIRSFSCVNNNIIFNTYEEFYQGIVIKKTIFNKVVN